MPRLLAVLFILGLCINAGVARAKDDQKDHQAASLHVIVALVDNDTQGIVPVPAKIGNGNDPANNLYWGAAYGVKTFLSKAPGWRRESCTLDVSQTIIERCIFTLAGQLEVVADAYRGENIGDAMVQFMREAAKPPLQGKREMVLFVGHNGLMDAKNANLVAQFPLHAPHGKLAGVLACLSDRYFRSHLSAAGAQASVTTFSFMAPEAYVVEAIARVFAEGGSDIAMREAAGSAYAKYQKISSRAGAGVFVRK